MTGASADRRPIRLTKVARDETPRRIPTAITFRLPPLDPARRLLIEADAEMMAGHHEAGERLSRRAAQLQGWGA